MAVKPVDFKFLTLFRLLFGAMLVLTFFMRWTKDVQFSGLDAWPGYIPPMITCDGLDYCLGCYPTFIEGLYVQTSYVILTPLIVIAGILIAMKPKRHYQMLSLFILMFSALPMIGWYLQVDSEIPDYYGITLTYGFQAFFAFLMLNMLLTLFAMKYTDLD